MPKITYNDILDIDKIIYQYHKIRTKTKHKRKIINFDLYKSSNLLNILNILKNKKYKHDKYNIFIISEPKYRIIMSENLNDKIINHLISEYVLIPLIEPKLINSNIATRKNKGTSYGFNLLIKYINKLKINYKEIYCLKIDIKKYFFNIDHEILLKKLNKIIKDKDLFNIIENIIKSNDEDYVNKEIVKAKQIFNKNIDNLPLYKKGKGLPIGNLSSQILAIFYSNDIDKFIKEKLKIKYYIRYMDDFVLLHPNKDYLKYCLKLIKYKLHEIKLELNDKTQIYNLNKGFNFLGYNFKLKEKRLIIKINNKTKKRIKRKIKNLKLYNQKKLKLVRASYKGYLQLSNCHILKILK